jgi:hypothetical protein
MAGFIIVATALISMWASPIVWASDGDGPPAFRGVRFDIKVTAQIGECPRQRTVLEHYASSPPTTCWMQEESGCITYPNLPSSSPDRCGFPVEIIFVDSLASALGRSFVSVGEDGKLERIMFGFSVKDFGDIATVFRAKYGRPATSRREAWQSKGGVRTRSQTYVWSWRGLRIRIVAPSSDLDHGDGYVETMAWLKSREADHENKLRRGVGDL